MTIPRIAAQAEALASKLRFECSEARICICKIDVGKEIIEAALTTAAAQESEELKQLRKMWEQTKDDNYYLAEHNKKLLRMVAAPPEGMVMVPREPTVVQVNAGVDADDLRTGFETVKHIYRAMLAAAEAPQEGE